MRALFVASLLLTVAAVGLAAPAAADNYGVGDCQKFGGACVGVCISDADTRCFRDGAVCVGASYQVPQCLPKQE